MTFIALHPNAIVLAAIDRKILAIVVEGRRLPGCFTVASGTILGKMIELMIRIRCAVEISYVASCTVVGGIIVIAIVTKSTIVADAGVGSIECIIIVVRIKSCRCPTGIGRMARLTIVRKV